MASCSLEDHKILLSDDAIFQLQKIEKMGATQIEENCRKFFSRFGSHALTGPLHFGGIFIWKCHSFGYVDSEKEQIRKLQDDAISASSAMLFPNEKKVSLLEDTSLDNYLQKLKDRTYIQTITIGGPSTMLGFPDWKYILTKCNKTWELIDHGLTQIAVWNVIIMNHAKDFNSSECLAKELKTQWARQASTKLNEIQSLHEEVQRNVLSVVVEEIPLKMQCNDFDSVRHFFKIALEVITSKPQSEVVTITDRIIHPQKAVRATLIVERAVHLLRNNLLKTKQNMIDCLLLTILNPLEYCPKKKIFPILLARSDIEYLYNNSKSIYEEFVRVQRQKSDLKTQSYIFYQATFLCDMLGVSIACLESHIEYLKNKIKQLSPNILTCLQALQTDQSCRKWNTFQAKMELFKNSEAYAREDKSGLCPVSVVEHHAPTQHMEQRIKKLFISLGLDEFFPQQLSLFHALQIRENLSGNHDPRLHPFIMLQKIMLFDPKCRMGVSGKGAKIHPMDALLALLHCSDNFLRQDIFSRFAACQFAVPLLLPHPYAREPTLLLWAMRSIVKECLSDAASDRIVKFPTAFVSFCRLGNPKVSLSEILNGVVKAEHDMFLNSNGAILSKGLVELSWRLQSLHSGSVPTLIAYANFHGDICDTDCKRQINFLCKISSVYVVLIENTMLEDANLECTVEVLKNLSGANRKVILVPSEDQEGIKNQLPDECQGVKWIDYDRSIKGLSKSIRKKVKKELKKSSCHYPLADLKDLTHSCCINIDEDMDDCVKGTDLAKRIFDMVKTPRQVLLPLQSDDLWTKWAKLDKEQYRQKKRDISSMKSVEGGWQYLQIPMNMHEYSEWLQTQKLEIRKRQFDLAREKNTFMSSFVNILKDEGDNGNLLSYFMLSLRMELDDLSRNQPSYYKDQTREINDQQAAKNSGELLNVLEMQNIDNRIGLEHILREMSQMYESFIEQKNPSITPVQEHKFHCLPHIAAKLLHKGFPIEIYDGDASHMPQKWVSAVLNCLYDIIKDSPVFILSVLGIQSTGKSTLLNTLFGAQFSVSAGRCTRGAFMQLIPVHPSMWEKMGVHFLLIIDTEGLRAPERERFDVHEYDNELATLVIGMANLTLITVHGEPLGEMENILHTAAHAFLRMTHLHLKPNCYIIHQHVPPKVGKKLMQGHFKSMKHLDRMAQYAAKETGRGVQFLDFSSIIGYNPEEDIGFFPDLWKGTLPMTQVSSKYSKEAQYLKNNLITKYIPKSHTGSIENVKTRMEGLWKAILHENFTFRFKNIIEIDYYKTVDAEFADWSWSFKKEITEWQTTTQNKLMGCTEEKLEDVFEERIRDLPKDIQKIHEEIVTKVKEFFQENEEKSEWMQLIQLRLDSLYEELKSNSEKHCKQMHQMRSDCIGVDRKKEELSKHISRRVQDIVSKSKLEGKTHSDKEFEESWKEWVHELTRKVERLPIPDIAKDVECTLNKHFKAAAGSMFLNQRLNEKTLTEWGKLLELTVRKAHLQPHQQPDLSKSQEHTNLTLKAVENHLNGLYNARQNYSFQFTTDLIHLLDEKEKKNSEFEFTEEYSVDMALTACGHAIPVFIKIDEAFRKKHDPYEYINHEIKPHLRRVFLNKYRDVKNEKLVTETLCSQLRKPLQNSVVGSVVSRICDETRENYSWMKTKHAFMGSILLEIGQLLQTKPENGFKLCIEFLTDAEKSLRYWSKHFTEAYCDSVSHPSDPSEVSVSHISKMSEEEFSKTTGLILEKVQYVTENLKEHEAFSVRNWMVQFHDEVKDIIQVSPSSWVCLFGDQKIVDANFFMNEIENGLKKLCEELKIEKYSEMQCSVHERIAHEILYKEIAGCTEQCPFCKAQCEHADKGHWPPPTDKGHLPPDNKTDTLKHRTEHRPQCFGNFRWAQDNTMILDPCPHLVAGFLPFRNKETKQEWKKYRDYQTFYPDWNIPKLVRHKTSKYWKWLIASYKEEIEAHFEFKDSVIPEEWRAITWKEVEDWLRTEYEL